jgi:hypothetical protein
MANENPKQSIDVWPLPKFYFQVKWDKNVMLFQEVSGLDVESTPVEYRGSCEIQHMRRFIFAENQQKMVGV